MTGRDRRSVGELLLDADHTARDVLMDVENLSGGTLNRTPRRHPEPRPSTGLYQHNIES